MLLSVVVPEMVAVPAIFTLPPIPAPPATTNAPVEDEVDAVVFVVIIAPAVDKETIALFPRTIVLLAMTAAPLPIAVALV